MDMDERSRFEKCREDPKSFKETFNGTEKLENEGRDHRSKHRNGSNNDDPGDRRKRHSSSRLYSSSLYSEKSEREGHRQGREYKYRDSEDSRRKERNKDEIKEKERMRKSNSEWSDHRYERDTDMDKVNQRFHNNRKRTEYPRDKLSLKRSQDRGISHETEYQRRERSRELRDHGAQSSHVEFYDAKSVPLASSLSSDLQLGQPVMAKPSDAEKDVIQSTTYVASASSDLISSLPGGARRLYVGNINSDIEEDQLRQSVSGVSGHSRTFTMQELNHTATTLSNAHSLGAPLVSSTGIPVQADPFMDVNTEISSLSVFLSADLSIPHITVPPLYTVGVPSECVVLKNMFDARIETVPDFEQDVKEDVEDKCSKYGKIRHTYVDKNSAGYVYVRFENSQSAIAAQRGLHGRWFAGKMITARFMAPEDYEARFPESKRISVA